MKKLQYEPEGFNLAVKRSNAGLGLFAMENIPKDACIIEYVGRVLSKEEEYTSRSKYLFGINSRKTIDGSARSNIARYINHSCKPNAQAEIYRGRILVRACRAISAGEEIGYDYGIEYWNEHIKPKGCRCANCTAIQKESRR